MNILILNWRDPKNPKSGGAELVTLQHARAWVKTGHNVHWLAYKFPKALAQEDIDGITIVRKGSAYTVHLFAFWYYLFYGNSFDIVIDEIHGIPFFTPLYVRKAKIIAFIHEIAGDIWDTMYPFPINVFGKLFEKVYFQFYKNIVFWTDAPSTIEDLVGHGIKKENCIAIPCPAFNDTLTELPQKEKDFTIIFVSRLVKMKGIEQVLSAFDLIHRIYPHSNLWIVGSGEEMYVKELKEITKKLTIAKNCVFYGQVSNRKKMELLKKAHLLLHASVKEGWGLVVIEAASQGTPSVVYNVHGLRDTVKNNITGIVIKSNNPELLAKEAMSLYKDKKRYHLFQKNCLKWASSLQWKKVTKQSLELLAS